MAYDAGMLYCVLDEIRRLCLGGKVERVLQPSDDEIDLLIHAFGESKRLCIRVGSNAPRLSLTRIGKENPAVPPMFCMLLRKHLASARLLEVTQRDFERVCELKFVCRDEMGFEGERTLVCEIMGKYSNLMLLDGARKILGVLRPVDFTTSRVRQVLPGMIYEMPPLQDKRNPLTVTREELLSLLPASRDVRMDKWITQTFRGIASRTASEIACRAAGEGDAFLSDCTDEKFIATFVSFFGDLTGGKTAPTLLLGDEDVPQDYVFFAPSESIKAVPCADFAELLDRYFGERERADRIRARGADLVRLIAAAEGRLMRKLEAQRSELAEAMKGEEYRRAGDLITANIYRLKRGMTVFEAVDYTLDPPVCVTVELDSRLAPAANAQRCYKKYTKAKHAREILANEIASAEKELAYLSDVEGFLSRAEGESDLAELRDELYRAGYGSRMKSYKPPKNQKLSVLCFQTSGGFTVLCGRNNIQNDRLTFKVAEKDDLWFHAKGTPGSHVILLTDGKEPGDEDYTQAAEIAAYYSSARTGGLVTVDYTRVRQIKKPPAAKPGYVIYHQNYSAYVKPIVSAEKTGTKTI